jgi:hypothetical protein
MFSQVVLTKATFVLDIVQRKDIDLNNLHDVWHSAKRKRAERTIVK